MMLERPGVHQGTGRRPACVSNGLFGKLFNSKTNEFTEVLIPLKSVHLDASIQGAFATLDVVMTYENPKK